MRCFLVGIVVHLLAGAKASYKAQKYDKLQENTKKSRRNVPESTRWEGRLSGRARTILFLG